LRGGAAFGFATRDGVQLLFGNREFRQFLEATDGFELVVGIDAITNIAALDKISALATQGLRARAFWHQRQPLLFHPKVSWFRRVRGMTLVVGSGNLTPGGLRSNWEAFVPQLASMWLLFYYFGSIVRYRPHQFDNIMAGSFGPFVSEFISAQSEQLLYLLASEMARREVAKPAII
jgi:YaaC-like Protein